MLIIPLQRCGGKYVKFNNNVYLLDLFEGRWEKGQCDLVCRVLLDDWAILVYVDVLFTYDKCSFSFLVSLSYSKEWVRILGAQSIHAFIHSLIHSFIHS